MRQDFINEIAKELKIPQENISGNILTTTDNKYEIIVKK